MARANWHVRQIKPDFKQNTYFCLLTYMLETVSEVNNIVTNHNQA